MRPQNTSGSGYEKVKLGEFVPGVISEVEYDNNHEFTYLQKKTTCPGVRFKLELEGYTYHKYTRWMKFNLGARANLYKVYVSKLVENAYPNIDFDLDELVGLPVKTVWGENQNGYQYIELIQPLEALTVTAYKNEGGGQGDDTDTEPDEEKTVVDETPKEEAPKKPAPKKQKKKATPEKTAEVKKALTEKPKAAVKSAAVTKQTKKEDLSLEDLGGGLEGQDDVNFEDLE